MIFYYEQISHPCELPNGYLRFLCTLFVFALELFFEEYPCLLKNYFGQPFSKNIMFIIATDESKKI